MQQKLLTPEEIAARPGSQIPFLRLPDRAAIFAERARRLRELAPGHAMGGYLELIAHVADAQHALLQRMPPIAIPQPEEIARSHEHGLPPLAFETHKRDPLWRDALRHLLRVLGDRIEGPARGFVMRLEGARDDLYEAQASKLLAGITFGLDNAVAPFIGAGLQLYFTHLVIALGEKAFTRIDVATLCPCCGSRPTASVARIGGEAAGYRFLHCALCNAEWHMVRIKCASCESTKGITYQSIDDGSGARKAVKAETCAQCASYLKIVDMERDHNVEPVADDLATLALDLLVTEGGAHPAGVNFMLIHGDPGEEGA